MFTGLVETVGRVDERVGFEKGVRFRVSAPDVAPALSEHWELLFGSKA